jgi:hypothetical protein
MECRRWPRWQTRFASARTRNALANWKFAGYIRFTEPAERWIYGNLAGLKLRDFGRLMWEHVRDGGMIDAVKETRPEWSEHLFHYDLRLNIAGRRIYVETRLYFGDANDPDDPTIHVVSVHDP